MKIYKHFLKRFLDIIFAIIGILLLMPLFILIAIAIKIDSKGPVFYRQERLGKHGKVFRIFKFRTMVTGAEHIGTGLFTDGNDSRITKVGFFLRKYSLDELPQLINVLLGDMSLIGPRPPVPYHPYPFNNYPEKYRVRFLYRPGITGWAQVHGRTNLTWTQRLEYDIQYHNKINFFLDLKIVFLTLKKIILSENIFPDDINIGKKHLETK
jgi:lipopolysaccharide/colanic/teichoic acid biosynthesis glycosyltransferase